MQVKDMFETEVFVGDTIAFAFGYRGTSMTTGEITDIREVEIDDYNSYDYKTRTYTRKKLVNEIQVRYSGDKKKRWLGVGREFIRKP